MSDLKSANQAWPIPTVTESKVIFDQFIKIRQDILTWSNQRNHSYYSLITKGAAVIILAVTDEGLLVLNEEYRHPTGRILLCCPGGYIDDQEDPIEAARRELYEETGYGAENFLLMGSAFPYPGLSAQKLYYVYAKNASKQGNPKPDPTELFHTVLYSRQELTQAIISGRDIDGTMCTALFFYDEVASVK